MELKPPPAPVLEISDLQAENERLVRDNGTLADRVTTLLMRCYDSEQDRETWKFLAQQWQKQYAVLQKELVGQKAQLKWGCEHTEALEKNWNSLVETVRDERDQAKGVLDALVTALQRIVEIAKKSGNSMAASHAANAIVNIGQSALFDVKASLTRKST